MCPGRQLDPAMGGKPTRDPCTQHQPPDSGPRFPQPSPLLSGPLMDGGSKIRQDKKLCPPFVFICMKVLRTATRVHVLPELPLYVAPPEEASAAYKSNVPFHIFVTSVLGLYPSYPHVTRDCYHGHSAIDISGVTGEWGWVVLNTHEGVICPPCTQGSEGDSVLVPGLLGCQGPVGATFLGGSPRRGKQRRLVTQPRRCVARSTPDTRPDQECT
ncbi:hypothetical protein NDU88_010623 [Pleurodeles waltl]|uniref:Uncharacterized protein n=1 Tax=Pleurodeles waltl TaxID=8319 RepID=A0AAV7QW81_PLEWA|nr:hypothetical protein NDU88_010623 [Pleurodeles waltl]